MDIDALVDAYGHAVDRLDLGHEMPNEMSAMLQAGALVTIAFNLSEILKVLEKRNNG